MNGLLTMILSIIGAAAWIPIIIVPILDKFRRIYVTVLDSRILTSAMGISAGNKERKNGTILMLVLNIYINKITIFANNITAIITLKNGTKLKTELLDFSTLTSNNEDGSKSVFCVPINNEMNISRTIHGNVDNIKFVSFLVESGSFKTINDIEEIKLYFTKSYKIFTRKAIICNGDFPKFNTSPLIQKCEEVQ